MAQSKTKDILYAGTFSERDSKGIYVFEFDRTTQSLTEIQTLADRESPTFLEVHPSKKFLYAIYREKPENFGKVAAFQIDQQSGKIAKINEQSTEGKNPCHISLDNEGKFLFVSNYGSGSLAVYSINNDGSLSKPTDVVQHTGTGDHPERQKEPHTHSTLTLAQGSFLYASDLGIDKIMVYTNDKNGKLHSANSPFIQTPPGSGPRHAALHPNSKYFFSNEELTSTIASYRIDNKSGSLTLIQRVTMLSKDTTAEGNSAADIHLSPDGKFLYASNRGQDNLVIYAINENNGQLTYVGHTRTEGKHPRNFMIDNLGEFIFVANRFTDDITIFEREPSTGKLAFTGKKITVPGVVCIKQLTIAEK